MGAGDRVVMLRIFFWNLSFSSTPALGGARAQISGGAVRAFAGHRCVVLLARVGGPKRAQPGAGRVFSAYEIATCRERRRPLAPLRRGGGLLGMC